MKKLATFVGSALLLASVLPPSAFAGLHLRYRCTANYTCSRGDGASLGEYFGEGSATGKPEAKALAQSQARANCLWSCATKYCVWGMNDMCTEELFSTPDEADLFLQTENGADSR